MMSGTFYARYDGVFIEKAEGVGWYVGCYVESSGFRYYDSYRLTHWGAEQAAKRITWKIQHGRAPTHTSDIEYRKVLKGGESYD